MDIEICNRCIGQIRKQSILKVMEYLTREYICELTLTGKCDTCYIRIRRQYVKKLFNKNGREYRVERLHLNYEQMKELMNNLKIEEVGVTGGRECKYKIEQMLLQEG